MGGLARFNSERRMGHCGRRYGVLEQIHLADTLGMGDAEVMVREDMWIYLERAKARTENSTKSLQRMCSVQNIDVIPSQFTRVNSSTKKRLLLKVPESLQWTDLRNGTIVWTLVALIGYSGEPIFANSIVLSTFYTFNISYYIGASPPKSLGGKYEGALEGKQPEKDSHTTLKLSGKLEKRLSISSICFDYLKRTRS
eukprot:Seg1389.20 transcript_id=Seg1389.20/GoldUCD/mRNA.D3Y31 product="hypothetical protein" protein_id=Seg1389.20/GoldUCD/D3Y31